MNKLYECNICQAETTSISNRCQEHYYCDSCKTKDHLIISNKGLLCRSCLDASIQEQIDKFKGDTTLEDHVICPHCGYKDPNSWEFTQSSIYSCGNCERDFQLELDITVTYSTYKLK